MKIHFEIFFKLYTTFHCCVHIYKVYFRLRASNTIFGRVCTVTPTINKSIAYQTKFKKEQ